MKKKSLGINALLNGIKSVISIIFPLITFPYISSILQVDNIGKYNFANAFVGYFALVAGLGISTYAIREGAPIREDKKRISEFASEIISINIISSLLSYIGIFICILCVPKLEDYRILIMIFSISIIFTTLGKDWIYSIYEEYEYITKRSILVQIISLILLFIFVKNSEDYIKYACITVFASAGANIFNYFHVKKYCNVRLIYSKNMINHLKPILILFGGTLATTIYVNSDMILLGFLTSNYHIGLYVAAEKIYRIIKTLLGSILIVSIPRLASLVGNKKKFNELFNKIYNYLIIIAIPSVVGIFMLSNEIIVIISDNSFINASVSLQILCIALVFALFAWIYSSCLLIPYKEEKKVFKVTLISAIINVFLNIILIPFFQEKAAAFTTLISELFAMLLYAIYSKKYINLNIKKRDVISIIVGCIGIICVCIISKIYVSTVIICMVISIFMSGIVYFFSLLILRNSILIEGIGVFKDKIKS